MSIPGPEDLSAYTSMRIPSKDNNESFAEAVNIGNLSQNQTFDTIYDNLITGNRAQSFHKSLDFSNVGIPLSTQAKQDSVSKLRQFHQTRLYIMDYDGMLDHTRTAEELGHTATDTYLISANLPESFSYKVGSKWASPFQDFTSNTANALMQLGGSSLLQGTIGAISQKDIGTQVQSLTSRVTTLQVWTGTEPLELTLKIPVIDDGHPNGQSSSVGLHTNLVEALEFLGSLCLPKTTDSVFGFYQPPPSPYEFTYAHLAKKKKDRFTSTLYSSNHARIMLQLGGILLVDKVIIKNIQVDYPNTKTMIRHWYSNDINPGANMGISSYLTPLLATVTITLSTAEALTANTYSKMLWLKQQKDQGVFSTNSTELKNVRKDIMEGIKNADQTMFGGKGTEIITNIYNGAKDLVSTVKDKLG